METLDKCDIVVDVGAAYDHDNKRYDHHQKLARNGISVRYEEVYKISMVGNYFMDISEFSYSHTIHIG